MLPEHTQVQIQVQPVSAPATDIVAHRHQVYAALVAAGLSLPTSDSSPAFNPLSAERREELAQQFSPPTERPLTALIIEDREGR